MRPRLIVMGFFVGFVMSTRNLSGLNYLTEIKLQKFLFLVFLFFISHLGYAASTPSRTIFYLTGGIDLRPPGVARVLDRLQQYAIEQRIGLVIDSHRDWRTICEYLQYFTSEEVGLIGHSYGAQAAVDIAKCAYPRRVNFIVGIDPIGKWFHEDLLVISENVDYAINYYQGSDLWLRGSYPYTRADSSFEGIENIYVPISFFTLAPHFEIISRVVGESEFYTWLKDKI